ncbi:ABC transporter ATP-binding protein [Oceanotoga sp.]|uniref:ABC transporter ATP-binding protein n=1 Tax=Oceanotoga sp. TaxID=2108366 RepID=UPI002804975E|nr:ABC transporter ATP-binding protein [Oceanotoga sp.]
MINYKNVGFKYSDSKSNNLKDISFSIKKGELVLLTGLSGSGKSTISKCLNGLIPNLIEGDLEGCVYIDNKSLNDKKIHEISKNVGSVFQDPRGQFFTTNTTSELAFTMENYGLSKDKIQKRIENVCKILNLNSILDKNILNISSGERQKLSIACALTMNPNILLFDEPSSNLDYKNTLNLRDILLDLKSKGYTIIIAEHRLFYLKNIIDKMIYIEDGKIKNIFLKEDLNHIEDKNLRVFDIFKSKFKNIGKNNTEEILSLKRISFKNILKDISFKTYKGDITAIIGKNGVGKTTLAKLISKIEKPNSGEIKLKGKSIFIMQDTDYQLFGSSVYQELKIGNPKITDKKIDEALKKVGLSSVKNKHPFSLSGGQKQRLTIALAYVSESDLIILDEPTSGLDAINMQKISDLIKDLSNNHAILIISHDFEFITNVCNSAIYLEDGKVSKEFNFKKDEEEQLINIFKELNL